MLGHTKGKRSPVTCALKCDNACSGEVCNTSSNSYFRDIASATISRRAALGFGAAGALAVVLGSAVTSAGTAVADGGTGLAAAAKDGFGASKLQFTAIPPVASDVDKLTVPAGFTWQPVIRWGDPIFNAAPDFDLNNQTAAAQEQQFGYNNDYSDILEIPGSKGRRAVLFANHEYTNESIMFPATMPAADVRALGQAAHGLTVVELERKNKNKPWSYVKGAGLNRRYLNSTVYELTGPVAGSALVKTAGDPSGRKIKGTLGNCSGGTTPWGTILSGEENFNGYFDASGPVDPANTTSFKRYGLATAAATNRGWSSVDERFDLAKHPHEAYRFGWVVEVDPYEPDSAPVKQTMLGRFKHEGANVTISRSGHAVAYMGDDERGDYLYKFVSADRFRKGGSRAARAHNKTLLTKGTLYVAKFAGDGTGDGEFDGTGTWVALTSDTTSHVPGMTVAEVLINTRLAADTVSPTKMDRPEDVEPNPVNGKIYAALTNNSDRGVKYPTDETNPLASSMVRSSLGAPLTSKSGNRNGYVLELTELGNDHTATTFTWDLFLVCGDPAAPETYFAGYDKSKVSPISCPDNVAFDAAGNLWLSTDGNVLGSNDGLFRVPVAGPERGRVEQFLTVPYGAETCGPLVTEDQLSVFVAVQHPGETDGATFETPSSTWPHTDGFPRPSVVVSYRR
jgi:secreted PhoX family phosphatase